MRVQAPPQWGLSVLAKSGLSRRQYAASILGCLYLALSTSSSAWYVTKAYPSFTNDLWWANYTANGHQAFVVDLFNAVLAIRPNGSVDVLASSATTDKSYTAAAATSDVYPMYARRLVLSDLTSVDYAVVNLRTMSASWFAYMATQYCWVDLAHEFEVAHTAERQQRCYMRHSTNGAVYIETVLRNLDWTDFTQNFGGPSGTFTVAFGSWLVKVPSGQKWLAVTSIARQTTSVDQEATYWRANGIELFQLQWQNRIQTGIDERIYIQNAWALQYDVVVKSIKNVPHTWTTLPMYWLTMGDFVYSLAVNRSLIRSANNSHVKKWTFSNLEDFIGLTDNYGNYVNQAQLFRTSVGPFGSVDMFVVAVPRSLAQLYESVRETIYTAMEVHPSYQVVVDAIPTVIYQPTPPSWASQPNSSFYGGSPLCLLNAPQPYIQQTFSFYDVCDYQLPFTVTVDWKAGVFASLANTISTAATCGLQTASLACFDHWQTIVNTSTTLMESSSLNIAMWHVAAADVKALNASIIQYTTSEADPTTWRLLHQPLLQDAAWAPFGWALLYDWVQSKREVVSFEGDVSTIVLMSSAD
ncbi:hypothetical protein As57867_012733, partial [Aphanomyces stellatus]